jgi:pimeloyl-ACP methyl ester carboxylesterase
MEQVNNGMVALIDHLGRDQAIWVGHDWVRDLEMLQLCNV